MLRVRFASRTGIFVALAAIAGLWASVAAAPANLVSNGTFDGSVASWAGAQWDPTDADGAPSSGSARVINNNPYMNYPNAKYGTQCLNGIVAGEEYRIAGDVFVAAGQGQDPGAGIGADGYNGLNCTGSWTWTISAATEGTGTWESLENTGMFPAGTKSAKVVLQTSKRQPVNPSGSVSALFDNITFGEPSAPPGRPYRLIIGGVAKQ